MKNTYSLKMEYEVKGKDTIINIQGLHPKNMSTHELIGFIECLKTLNDTCVDVANERIRNGSSKNKKK